MATIKINEKELREYVLELIDSEDELTVSQEIVDERIDAILSELKDSPKELLGGIILEDIYFEAELEEGKDIEVENEIDL